MKLKKLKNVDLRLMKLFEFIKINKIKNKNYKYINLFLFLKIISKLKFRFRFKIVVNRKKINIQLIFKIENK